MRQGIMPAIRGDLHIQDLIFTVGLRKSHMLYAIDLEHVEGQRVTERHRIWQRCIEKSLEPVARDLHMLVVLQLRS